MILIQIQIQMLDSNPSNPDPKLTACRIRIRNFYLRQYINICSRPAGRCAAGPKAGAAGTGGVPPRAPPPHPRLGPRPGRRSRGDCPSVRRRPSSCRPYSR